MRKSTTKRLFAQFDFQNHYLFALVLQSFFSAKDIIVSEIYVNSNVPKLSANLCGINWMGVFNFGCGID